MADSKKVVVTGYGAWEKTEANPSAQILGGLRQRTWADCELVALEVPVITAELHDWVEKTLLAQQPAVWMGIGVAPGSPAMRAEVIGTNWRHFDVPDNTGVSPQGEPVVDGGPAAYNADFPNKEIVAAWRAAGIPAVLSYSACTHMCNQMLYTSSHLIRKHALPTRCGFLHVPLTPEHVARHGSADTPEPSMSLELMTEAAVIALEQVISVMKAAA